MGVRGSNWLIDLGNTRLKWAHGDDQTMRDVHALSHVEGGAIDAQLDDAFAEMPGGATAWLASVAGDALTADVIAALERRAVRVRRVRTQADFAGVRIAYAEPARLGVDRFLALIAAHARGHKPWLIASVGTGVCFRRFLYLTHGQAGCLVDLDLAIGEHDPGIKLMMQSLFCTQGASIDEASYRLQITSRP